MAERVVDPRFAARMRDLLHERGMSFRALGARTFYAKSHLHAIAAGRKQPTVEAAARIDEALGGGGELVGYVVERAVDELAALELAQRVAATDVSAETLDRLERAVDELAMVYPRTPPAELLVRVRQHVAYVRQLLERRKTLDQHRRLLVVGGWLEQQIAPRGSSAFIRRISRGPMSTCAHIGATLLNVVVADGVAMLHAVRGRPREVNRELPDRGLVPSIECDGNREGGGALKKRHIPVGRAQVRVAGERDESGLADSIERLRFLTRDGRP